MNDIFDLDDFSVIPPNFVQHFHPEPHFMDWLVGYAHDRFVIEVGAGMCEFTKAMHTYNIKALAVEPRPCPKVREECFSFLMPVSVQKCKMLRDTPALVIAARPDHSGWFGGLNNLIHPNSELAYIGLPRNFNIDLEGLSYTTKHREAGEDGEQFLEIV